MPHPFWVWKALEFSSDPSFFLRRAGENRSEVIRPLLFALVKASSRFCCRRAMSHKYEVRNLAEYFASDFLLYFSPTLPVSVGAMRSSPACKCEWSPVTPRHVPRDWRALGQQQVHFRSRWASSPKARSHGATKPKVNL